VKEEIVTKYVRDLEGLKKEVKSYKQRLCFPEEKDWERLLPIYHGTVIFFFSIIYKYLVFEHVPIFTGRKGLDAWIENKGKKINVEFEVRSGDFPTHHSDEQKQECDVIVCWRDNSRKEHELWKHIDVFELKHFWE
jgi:hypothetical protein